MSEAGFTPRRALVVQTAFFGDVVLATPLLAALRGRYPEARLAFLGTPSGVELIRGLEGVDEFIAFDKRGQDRGWGGLSRKARELEAQDFDLAVSVHRSVRTAVLLARAKIKLRIGFATADLPWLYHHRVPFQTRAHEIERDLALLDPIGGPPPDFAPTPRLPKLPPAGEDLLGPQDGGPPPLRVGICPGSVWPTKRWSARGFGQVAAMLEKELGARVYLIGSESDRAAAAEVEAAQMEAAEAVAGVRSGVVNLAGKTRLADWVRLIGAMDLIITNDSAPTHVASALSVPTVAIYGPTTPAQGFGPRAPRRRVVEVPELSCRPCGRHGAKRCPEGHFKCMGLIAPEAVAAAARALLSGEA